MLLIRRYLSAAAAQVQRADDDVDDDDDDEADADDDEAEDDKADDDEADDDEADADDVNKGMTKTSSSLFAGVLATLPPRSRLLPPHPAPRAYRGEGQAPTPGA